MARTLITKAGLLEALSQKGAEGVVQLFQSRGTKGIVLADQVAVDCWEILQESSVEAVKLYLESHQNVKILQEP